VDSGGEGVIGQRGVGLKDGEDLQIRLVQTFAGDQGFILAYDLHKYSMMYRRRKIISYFREFC
jgi:hypothetical protein